MSDGLAWGEVVVGGGCKRRGSCYVGFRSLSHPALTPPAPDPAPPSHPHSTFLSPCLHRKYGTCRVASAPILCQVIGGCLPSLPSHTYPCFLAPTLPPPLVPFAL